MYAYKFQLIISKLCLVQHYCDIIYLCYAMTVVLALMGTRKLDVSLGYSHLSNSHCCSLLKYHYIVVLFCIKIF